MKRPAHKKYFLYLTNSRLVGMQLHAGHMQRVMDTDAEHPQTLHPVSGEAILILNREALQHQIISIPVKGKVPIHRVMANEVETLTKLPPEELVYDWRSIGTTELDGGVAALYLLAAHPSRELAVLLENLKALGFSVTRIISFLDLLIERGRTLPLRGGSGLMVFEDPVVHFLFFCDGVYGFERSFELRQEGFEKDFLLEIQRSFFYAKQKFKIPIEKVVVAEPPEWLTSDLVDQLQEGLAVSIDTLVSPQPAKAEPGLSLLKMAIREFQLLKNVVNLLPQQLIRERETRKFCWALSCTEAVLLVLMIVLIQTTHRDYQDDLSALNQHEEHRRVVAERLSGYHDLLFEMKDIENTAATVENYLSHKKNLHVYLSTLPWNIPPEVHLDTICWGSVSRRQPLQPLNPPEISPATSGGNTMVLTGTVDASAPEDRLARFSAVLATLKQSPYVRSVGYNGDNLFTTGAFIIEISMKDLSDDDGLNP